MQLLYCHYSSGSVTLHGEDSCRGWHLEDQIPIMGNGHEPVQSRSANNGVEWEVHLRNIELSFSVRKFFSVPNMTGREMIPTG
jgi:hypothetical protein